MRITRNFMKFHYVVTLTLSESNLKMYTKLTKICQISICKYSNSRNCVRTAKFRIFEFYVMSGTIKKKKKERKIKQGINNRIYVWNVWKTYLRRLEVIFSNGIFPLHKLHLQTFITSLTTITLLTPNNSFLA